MLPVTAAYSITAQMQNVFVSSHTGMDTESVLAADSVSKITSSKGLKNIHNLCMSVSF